MQLRKMAETKIDIGDGVSITVTPLSVFDFADITKIQVSKDGGVVNACAEALVRSNPKIEGLKDADGNDYPSPSFETRDAAKNYLDPFEEQSVTILYVGIMNAGKISDEDKKQ